MIVEQHSNNNFLLTGVKGTVVQCSQHAHIVDPQLYSYNYNYVAICIPVTYLNDTS